MVDLAALVANWRLLGQFAPGAATGAAVKADAYGLGLTPVASALHEAGCRHFFVANVEEGIAARKAAPWAEIFVLGGLLDENSEAFVQAALTPVINHSGEVEIWRAAQNRASAPLPFALHADTGLNRLGMEPGEIDAWLANPLPGLGLLMSHFACADHPSHPMNARQAERFAALKQRFPGIRASLANSAAILADAGHAHDLTRPGIALYGGEAIDGTVGPMANVATFEARILQIRHAKKGEAVGYGASAVLMRDSLIAIAGAGYGDGIPRAASGSGVAMRELREGAHGAIEGIEIPMLGRVSMDLTAFDVTDVPRAILDTAEWIEFFGNNIALDDFARAAGTIGYEVLTGIGRRAERVYRSETRVK